jgi:hypothetical protein
MNNKTCGECCHLEETEHFSFRCKHCNSTVSSSNTACNHFSKQYGICPECGSYLFSYEHTEDNDWQLCTCTLCGCSGTPKEFLYNSAFARITESPDALADKLVYKTLVVGNNRVTYSCWRSTITEESYRTKKEAIAATLVELERVTERETIEEEE